MCSGRLLEIYKSNLNQSATSWVFGLGVKCTCNSCFLWFILQKTSEQQKKEEIDHSYISLPSSGQKKQALHAGPIPAYSHI